MNGIGNRVMQTNFSKFFRRFIIAAIVAVLVSGIAAGVALRPQIHEIIAHEQTAVKTDTYDTAQQQTFEWDDAQTPGDWNEHHAAWKELQLAEPTTGAKVAAGLFGVICVVVFAVYWLTIAAWLYQAAVNTGFHGFLWFLLALVGNLLAVILFLLLRSFLRKQCGSCGKWQSRWSDYCSACGARLTQTCPHCGATCTPNARYCHNCGKPLQEETET